MAAMVVSPGKRGPKGMCVSAKARSKFYQEMSPHLKAGECNERAKKEFAVKQDLQQTKQTMQESLKTAERNFVLDPDLANCSPMQLITMVLNDDGIRNTFGQASVAMTGLYESRHHAAIAAKVCGHPDEATLVDASLANEWLAKWSTFCQKTEEQVKIAIKYETLRRQDARYPLPAVDRA